MTDETGSAGAGNLAGAAALLAGNEDTTTTTTATGGGADTATGGAAPEWLKDATDEARTLVQTKGWKSPADVLTSYTQLEGLVGREKIPAPKDENDAEGYERLHKALGKPDSPEGYQLKAPDGADPAFAGEASKWFHEAGLGAKQAQALAGHFNAYIEQTAQAEAKAFEVRSGQELGALKTEWGDQFNSNLELSRRAARQFGLEATDLGALERGLGTKKMLGFLQKVGAGLGEDTYEGGNTRGGSFKLSAGAARERIEALKKDSGWVAKFTGGDADAKAEWNRLHELAHPAA